MRVVLLLAILLFVHGPLSAQGDSATHYIHGLPVSEDDTVQNFPANDYAPANEVIVVPAGKLPENLLNALNEKSEFKGWERLPVLKEVNTGIYRVRILNKTDTTFFGLNENGKVVSYGKNSVDDQ